MFILHDPNQKVAYTFSPPDPRYQSGWIHPVYPQCNCDHCKRVRKDWTMEEATRAVIEHANQPQALRPEDV